jgi:biotin carboxyl carrier protein
MKTYNRISADKPGVITEIKVSNGASVDEDDVLMMIS